MITGEGRYDNTADGKAPSVIAMLAKKHAKKAILVCGQIDKKAVGSYRGGIIHCEDEPQFFRQGIEQVLTCQEYFDSVSLPDSYEACIRLFREQTSLLRRAGRIYSEKQVGADPCMGSVSLRVRRTVGGQ